MYLEIPLKAKFGVCAELWSIVKRWYPVLTQSFDIVCNDDGKFQRLNFTALFGAKCFYIWDHKMGHLWLCYATVKRWVHNSTRLTTKQCLSRASRRLMNYTSHSHITLLQIKIARRQVEMMFTPRSFILSGFSSGNASGPDFTLVVAGLLPE